MSISTRNKLCKLLIIGALALSVQCSEHHTPTPPTIPASEIQAADIVFRLGCTLQSEAIASHGTGGYSHIGIVVDSDSTKNVIHIEPDRQGSERIKIEPLAVFFHPNNAMAGCAMRYNAISDSLQRRITEYAKTLLSSSITFDHDYQLSDPSRMYCTELVEHIFAQSGISLSEKKRIRLPLAKEPVIMPSAIYENDSLTLIWSYRAE